MISSYRIRVLIVNPANALASRTRINSFTVPLELLTRPQCVCIEKLKDIVKCRIKTVD